MNLKKLLALLLALVMVLSLAACSNSDEKEEDEDEKTSGKKDKDEDEEDTIVGSWEAEVDMSDLINTMMESELSEYAEYFEFKDMTIVMCVTFEEDGDYTAEIDKDSVEEMAEGMMADMEDGVVAMIEGMIEDEGLDMTVDEFMEMSGMSMDDLMESFDTDSMVEEMTSGLEEMKGEYEIDDDKLYMFEDEKDEDDYIVFELDGDELSFVEASDESMDEDEMELMETMLPIEFKRVD